MYHSTRTEDAMKSTPLFASTAAFAALTLVTGASYGQDGQSTLAKVQSVNLIAIGHRETSVPFSYVDAGNNVIGFSQDLCNRVIEAVKAKTGHADLRVRFIPVTSQNRISLVQNGTVDLECGVTTNLTARQNQVAFSDTFFVATTRLLTKKDSGIKDFPDLAGKTVVTNQGTTSERILRKMNEEKKMNMSIISGGLGAGRHAAVVGGIRLHVAQGRSGIQEARRRRDEPDHEKPRDPDDVRQVVHEARPAEEHQLRFSDERDDAEALRRAERQGVRMTM
jgi:glutamate/aspartate transport system substrate-binding protein